ncbi:MAG: adenylate/guanylate cyclase domain-containing protein [bacterium]|nr:adenylate/guanylate cyclase domain-containing protein [bacterium]
MAALPTGTITFLFTDIEGSTRLLADLADRFASVLERHQTLIRESVSRHCGTEIKTEGDSFFCVFITAADGLAAAVDIQRSMAAEDWVEGRSVRVRIGVHTGVGALGGDDYVGIDVNRGARISETGHGGQVLVSAATRLLGEAGLPDGVAFNDLGEVHLRDLDRPEHLYELTIDGLDSAFPPLRKLEAGPTNLPASSGFIGRAAEQAQVTQLLGESRLVTITGVAGSGKSRLALEVATALRDTYTDGVWLVELASVTSDELIAQAVSHAIGLQESPGRSATDVLADYLRNGKRLLVLDNCESFIDSAGQLASHLIASTANLTILATSQQVLGTAGEARYQCPPLAMPSTEGGSPSELLDFDAVALFQSRAAAVDSAFVLNEENAPFVAAICRSLDGMPLAIELAAALVRILTPQQILDRLDDRFELLTGGPRSAPEHHQTLRAALDSTFELLNPENREFAARLGVFVGGFDVVAAEAVTAGGGITGGDVVNGLSALVDRSLITSTQAPGGLRFAILESVRAYLLDKLKAGGQLRVRQIAHAKHFGALIEDAARGLRGPDQDLWDARLETDIENVRSTLAFSSAAGDDTGLRQAGQMFLYWRSRGDWSDGLHWTQVALDNSSERDSPLRARMLATAGFFASDLGDGVRGISDLEEALAMARRTYDSHSVGYCSSFLGADLSRRDTDLDRGLALLCEAQQIYADLEEPYGEAWVNRYLALSFQERGDFVEAIRLHTLSLDAFRDVDDPWNIRFAQTLVGEALHTIAELIRSRDLYNQSLRGSADTRYKVVIAHAYKGLGKVSLAERKLDEASGHLAKAAQELQGIGDVACLAETRGHLAMVNLARGHPVVASDALVGSLVTFRDIADLGGVAWVLERLAAVAVAEESFERAAQLLGAGTMIRAESGSMRAPVDQPLVDRLSEDLRARLGAPALEAAIAAGTSLDFDVAIELGVT